MIFFGTTFSQVIFLWPRLQGVPLGLHRFLWVGKYFRGSNRTLFFQQFCANFRVTQEIARLFTNDE